MSINAPDRAACITVHLVLSVDSQYNRGWDGGGVGDCRADIGI